MNIFVIGATGFVGGGVARHLVAAGHRVGGLARSDTAAERLRRDGITPHRGELGEPASAAEAVIYAAQPDPQTELEIVTGLIDILAGSFAEDDPFTVEPLARPRFAAEGLVRQAAERDVRAIVMRPGLIWGPGDHGHLSMIYQSVAATGAACYVGEGLNTYTNVHIDDVAHWYEAVLAKGTAGALYHAAGGEIPNRWIAEAVARDLGCGPRSLTPDEAQGVWGEFGALIMGASSRSRDSWTRTEIGWKPERTDLLSMVGDPRLRQLANRLPGVPGAR
jgi:nucleoside-diphosphate-sugar epimerase